jgi:hypothetical protein
VPAPPIRLQPPTYWAQSTSGPQPVAGDLAEITDWLRAGAELRAKYQLELLEAEKRVEEAQAKVRTLKLAIARLPEAPSLREEEPETVKLQLPAMLKEETTAPDTVRAIIDANTDHRLTSGDIFAIAASVHPRAKHLDLHSALYRLVKSGEFNKRGEKGQRTYARAKPKEATSE